MSRTKIGQLESIDPGFHPVRIGSQAMLLTFMVM